MNKKYVINNGLAFNEESDMKKLGNYAKQGWVLEDIVAAGFLYKLKKDAPKDINYSMDYQEETTEEYFSMFSEAGWTLVVSLGNKMHIFSAPSGTKPIYSDCESEIDKYTSMKKKMGRGSIYSSIITFIFAILLVISAIIIRPIFLIILIIFIASIFPFVFNFLPYLVYNYKLKKMRKK